jgi:hypothetical protein
MDGVVMMVVHLWHSLGGFVEGKMSGKGVLSLTNGERFDGTFVEGTIEGAG